MIHSSTLGFSPRLPVSVCGTGCYNRFSWKLLRWIITLAEASVYYPLITQSSTHYSVSAHQLHVSVALLYSRYWNINQLSIDYPFRVRLRPRLTLIRLALIRKP